MKIRDIASHVDLSLAVGRSDLSRSAREILRQGIESGDVDKFLRQDGRLDEFSQIGMLGLLQFRERTLSEQKREHHGFVEAIEAVKQLPDDEKVYWMAIKTASHLLVVLVRSSNCEVVGCMSLKRNDNKLPVTWDGSGAQ